MAFSSGSAAGSGEINVTPLIDVLLVLVIIFLLIAPQAQRGLESELPQSKSASTQATTPIVVEVRGDAAQTARYLLSSRVVTLQELRPQLAAMLARRSDRGIFLRADRALSYQQVAAVVSLAHAAGASSVALDSGRE